MSADFKQIRITKTIGKRKLINMKRLVGVGICLSDVTWERHALFWLAEQHLQVQQKPMGGQKVKDAMATLEGTVY